MRRSPASAGRHTGKPGCRMNQQPGFFCVGQACFSADAYATGDTQCGTDGGQDGDQCLDDDFPDVLLVVSHK